MSLKPPYAPLTMAQVQAAPMSGLTHVSTFSGAGGTCLGFRMAGFRTLWANDIEDHARHCYSLNLESPIDGRDIRHLTAADILTATGLKTGELDVFEGSPPCTAFSSAGKLAKGWHQSVDHAGHVQANIEDLFFDWLTLLEGLQPRAFVAENVAGLVRGVSKGYFKAILRQMKALGYQTEARILDAQWLGVPQRRSRVIFIGIRSDVQKTPAFPSPLPYRYSVRDALPWITSACYDTQGQFQGDPEFVNDPCPTLIGAGARAGQNATHYMVMPASRQKLTDRAFMAQDIKPYQPSPVVTKGGSGDLCIPDAQLKRRKFTIEEVKRICSFPDDFKLEGSYAQQWARLGNSVPPLMAAAIGRSLREVLQ